MSDPSSSSTPESTSTELCRAKGLACKVRWLQQAGAGSHLAGHTLISWPHSSLVSPKLPPEDALHAQVTTGQPHVSHPRCRPSCTDQELLPCITQSKGSTWGKERSQQCARGANPCCQLADPAAQRWSCCCPLLSWGPGLSLCLVRQEAKGKSK